MALPGSTVRIRVEARAARWLDCPGPRKGRCVELTMRSRPDREDVARVLAALMEKLGAPRQAVQGALGELATTMDATVVTEPSTLVPHRVEVKRTTDVTGPAGEALSRVDEQRWTYAYARAAAKARSGLAPAAATRAAGAQPIDTTPTTFCPASTCSTSPVTFFARSEHR
ncbi:MAG TPA: hypothetical protein VFL83_06580 [Anaeromyxobacter sp.]|nr:hypothetical protein [Anaeromyxobacter sp.]